eukprot:3627552-Prymnesium_polylepis.1
MPAHLPKTARHTGQALPPNHQASSFLVAREGAVREGSSPPQAQHPPRDVEPGLGGRGDACTTGQPDGHSTAQPQAPFPFDLECRQHGSGTCTQARSSKGHPLQ